VVIILATTRLEPKTTGKTNPLIPSYIYKSWFYYMNYKLEIFFFNVKSWMMFKSIEGYFLLLHEKMIKNNIVFYIIFCDKHAKV
jgi:hypothetical protein